MPKMLRTCLLLYRSLAWQLARLCEGLRARAVVPLWALAKIFTCYVCSVSE